MTEIVNTKELWRKRRIRRWILTHPRMPLRISWALRRFTVTPEQDAVVHQEAKKLVAEILTKVGAL